MKTVKTPKRYPTKDAQNVETDRVNLSLVVPAWAIKGADAMVGFTHEDIGQIIASLRRWTGTADDAILTLRSNSNAGETNNFTSYDLLQKPALGGPWFTPADFTLTGRTWYLRATDSSAANTGQVEYLQIQVTVRTLPNRADADSDGLNDSKEPNLGSDGFQTDPWKEDTDGDVTG